MLKDEAWEARGSGTWKEVLDGDGAVVCYMPGRRPPPAASDAETLAAIVALPEVYALLEEAARLMDEASTMLDNRVDYGQQDMHDLAIQINGLVERISARHMTWGGGDE